MKVKDLLNETDIAQLHKWGESFAKKMAKTNNLGEAFESLYKEMLIEDFPTMPKPLVDKLAKDIKNKTMQQLGGSNE